MKILVFILCFWCLFLLTSPVALAQSSDEATALNVEGVSKAATSFEAAKEIQARVISETARTQVIEVIGEKRYQKSRQLVESRIVREAARFIPFVNAGSPVKLPDGSWKMSVELKILQSSLRKMVIDAGLLNDAEGPASVLPMITFTNRMKGVSSHWWMGEEHDDAHKFLLERSRAFHDVLFKEMNRQGFYLLRPQGLTVSPLPESLRIEKPESIRSGQVGGSASLKSIGAFFQTPMILRGDVKIRESSELTGAYSLSVRLQVFQAANGRSIAEVTRSFETDSGSMETVVRNKLNSDSPDLAKDLAIQVLEAWQRGTLNTNIMRVAVRGSLNPKQLADFKTNFMKLVRDVKSLKERLFEPGQIVFEADLAGSVSDIVGRLSDFDAGGVKVHLVSSSDQGLVLSAQPK
jgi:hypothetical protein